MNPFAVKASVLITLVISLAFSTENEQSTNQEKEGFIEGLMYRMTLEEKIGQLTLFSYGHDMTGPKTQEKYLDEIRSGKVGAIFNAIGAEYTMKLQKMAVEETRLGIPLLFGYDVIHGYRTIFPMPLGEAASRSDIGLPGVQEELALELAKTGKPMVVVLMNGRPLTIERIHENVPAILETWFPGTTAGDAIADVLF